MKKTVSIILGVIVLLFFIAAAWYVIGNRPQQPVSLTVPPSIVGALVSINADHTQITVKAADGASQTFAVSDKTPIITDAGAGQKGETLAGLNAGDVLAVAASPNDQQAANDIEIIPLSLSPSAPNQPAHVITGAVVSIASSSIVIDPGNQPPGMPKAYISIGITKNTEVYTQVESGQTGKTLADIGPGTAIRAYIAQPQPPYSASAVLILMR